MDGESLLAELNRLHSHFGLAARDKAAVQQYNGVGGWWEFGGYANILADAAKRVRKHRNRTLRIQNHMHPSAPRSQGE